MRGNRTRESCGDIIRYALQDGTVLSVPFDSGLRFTVYGLETTSSLYNAYKLPMY